MFWSRLEDNESSSEEEEEEDDDDESLPEDEEEEDDDDESSQEEDDDDDNAGSCCQRTFWNRIGLVAVCHDGLEGGDRLGLCPLAVMFVLFGSLVW